MLEEGERREERSEPGGRKLGKTLELNTEDLPEEL
jgi:hypothetical protein